jgi:hypothetical protein
MGKVKNIRINTLIGELENFLFITKNYIASMEEINKKFYEPIYIDENFYQPCINALVIQITLGALEKRNDSIENISAKLHKLANTKEICNILGLKYKGQVFKWVEEGVETIRDFIKFSTNKDFV